MGYTYVRDMEAILRNEQNTVLSEVKTALTTLTINMDGKFAQIEAKLGKVDRDIFRTNAVGVFILGIIVLTQPKLLEIHIYC